MKRLASGLEPAPGLEPWFPTKESDPIQVALDTGGDGGFKGGTP